MIRRAVPTGLFSVVLWLSPVAASASTGPIHLRDYRALVRIASPRFCRTGR